MVVTTHQPIFLPWPGFFFKALCADVMVLLDRVQFPLGRTWMTRNRLKSDKGELWLRVPVWRRRKGKQIVEAVEIAYETDWRRKHLRGIRDQYANAPYLEDYLPHLESIYGRRPDRLVELNIELIRLMGQTLGLAGKLVLQSDLGVSGKGNDLLVSICRALGGDAYVTLPPVAKYLDVERFRSCDIRLLFIRFDPPVYPQLWGDFRFNLSTLDLLLNCGPAALKIIGRQEHLGPARSGDTGLWSSGQR